MAKPKGEQIGTSEMAPSLPQYPQLEYSPISKVNKTIFVVVRSMDRNSGVQSLEARPITVEYEWDAENRKVLGFKSDKLDILATQTVEGVFD